MIYVFGSINVDLVVYSQRLPEPGETITGIDFLMNQGGKGANQAVAASKLGSNVVFLGRIGNDFFGEFAIESIRKYGVQPLVSIDKNIHTGLALIHVNSEGENSITIIEGANGRVGEEELSQLSSRLKVKDILLLQGEIPIRALKEAVNIAKKAQAIIIFDPAPVRSELLEIIPFITYVTPNEVELKKLTFSNDPFELINLGALNVILKLGSKGVFFKNKVQEFFVESFKVEAVDTTGAGDTFNGSFASALDNGCGVRDALVFASAASAISVTRKGASISSPNKEEVINFLEVQNEKSCY